MYFVLIFEAFRFITLSVAIQCACFGGLWLSYSVYSSMFFIAFSCLCGFLRLFFHEFALFLVQCTFGYLIKLTRTHKLVGERKSMCLHIHIHAHIDFVDRSNCSIVFYINSIFCFNQFNINKQLV